MSRFFLALCLLALAGCPSRDVSRVDPRQTVEQVKEIPINLNREVDILFVVDNSFSMEEEQRSLQRNFPAFIEVLERIEGGLPSVHLAVVSSDLGIGARHDADGCHPGGDRGAFRLGERDDCSAITDGRRYLATEAAGGGNFTGSLSDAFACMAGLGTEGCGFEHHLESMKQALVKGQEAAGENGGFLREEAYLAVIIIADEDDCSATPEGANALFDPAQDSADSELGFFSSFRCWEYGVVCDEDDPAPRDMPREPDAAARIDCRPRDEERRMARVADYVDFLKGLKRDPRRVVVAGIIGEPADRVRVALTGERDVHTLLPACSSANGVAAPPTRIQAFLDGFPDRATQQSICEEDLSSALTQIAELLEIVIGTPCLDGDLIDTDVATETVEPDCRVTDYQYKGSDREVSTSLPSCARSDGARPCYEIREDRAACVDTPTGLVLEVLRDGEPPPETTVGVRCAAR